MTFGASELRQEPTGWLLLLLLPLLLLPLFPLFPLFLPACLPIFLLCFVARLYRAATN